MRRAPHAGATSRPKEAEARCHGSNSQSRDTAGHHQDVPGWFVLVPEALQLRIQSRVTRRGTRIRRRRYRWSHRGRHHVGRVGLARRAAAAAAAVLRGLGTAAAAAASPRSTLALLLLAHSFLTAKKLGVRMPATLRQANEAVGPHLQLIDGFLVSLAPLLGNIQESLVVLASPIDPSLHGHHRMRKLRKIFSLIQLTPKLHRNLVIVVKLGRLTEGINLVSNYVVLLVLFKL